MSSERRTSIADVDPRRTSGVLAAATFVGALLVGLGAAAYYWRLGLTLSHHDARAHLMVTRRIIDSLTPGWQQVGALWLPLPHLLNLLPIAWDWNYRTGFSAVLISVVSMAWGLAALARYLVRRTGAWPAAMAGALLVLLNPNVLYLQSTPMTEPLLFGFTFVALDAVDAWLDNGARPSTVRVATLLGLLVLTRYEAWPLGMCLLLGAALASPPSRWRDLLRIATAPALAVAGFLAWSKASVGQWFVSSGFFMPDNVARGSWPLAVEQLFAGIRQVANPTLIAAAAAGVVVCLWHAWKARSARPLLPFSLLAMALIPVAAFEAGHPFRIRYAIPAVVGAGMLAALAVAALPVRARALAAALLVGASVWLTPPLGSTTPMLAEAQAEGPARAGRQAVSAVLASRTDRWPIMGSMQSLGHYMQETSAIGLDLADFLHEGNGDLWTAALNDPRRYVRWILMEENADGGDVLAQRSRTHPGFLDGFTRVAAGGGVALYRRDQ